MIELFHQHFGANLHHQYGVFLISCAFASALGYCDDGFVYRDVANEMPRKHFPRLANTSGFLVPPARGFTPPPSTRHAFYFLCVCLYFGLLRWIYKSKRNQKIPTRKLQQATKTCIASVGIRKYCKLHAILLKLVNCRCCLRRQDLATET